MPEILLSTLNTKYIHSAFGLRYLMANLGLLRARAIIAEFDINQRPLEIAEALLAHNPRIIGLGVYIWNVVEITEVVTLLKRLRPEIIVVLGGPEVSYEWQSQPVVLSADYLITGEGDLAFRELCERLLKGEAPLDKVIPAPLPQFKDLVLPYYLYDDRDIAHRVIYVEASRGCPFSCEFCLSSLDIPVRQADLTLFLESLDDLLARGATHLKFVDRTFNLNIKSSLAILEFLLARWREGRLFHFEMVPDRLPEVLRSVLGRFPPGALQLEVGIQTFSPAVADRISRRQDYRSLEENLRFLRSSTGVHIHADLIAGLPGESLEGFANGFNKLISLNPHEIQVGILKRLRGTPISRHDEEWQMVYNPLPPYDALQNRLIDFQTMQQLRRFARHWDLVGNSGNFINSTPLLWTASRKEEPLSGDAFQGFWAFSQWLHRELGRTDSIALTRLMELLFRYLTSVRGLDPATVAQAVWKDYLAPGNRHDKPSFLKDFLPDAAAEVRPNRQRNSTLKRQNRHSAASAATASSGNAWEDNL